MEKILSLLLTLLIGLFITSCRDDDGDINIILIIIIITVMMIMMTAIHVVMLIKLEDIARGLYVTVLGIVGNIDDCNSYQHTNIIHI